MSDDIGDQGFPVDAHEIVEVPVEDDRVAVRHVAFRGHNGARQLTRTFGLEVFAVVLVEVPSSERGTLSRSR